MARPWRARHASAFCLPGPSGRQDAIRFRRVRRPGDRGVAVVAAVPARLSGLVTIGVVGELRAAARATDPALVNRWRAPSSFLLQGPEAAGLTVRTPSASRPSPGRQAASGRAKRQDARLPQANPATSLNVHEPNSGSPCFHNSRARARAGHSRDLDMSAGHQICRHKSNFPGFASVSQCLGASSWLRAV